MMVLVLLPVWMVLKGSDEPVGASPCGYPSPPPRPEIHRLALVLPGTRAASCWCLQSLHRSFCWTSSLPICRPSSLRSLLDVRPAVPPPPPRFGGGASSLLADRSIQAWWNRAGARSTSTLHFSPPFVFLEKIQEILCFKEKTSTSTTTTGDVQTENGIRKTVIPVVFRPLSNEFHRDVQKDQEFEFRSETDNDQS